MTSSLLSETRDGIATITLNRPSRRNALSRELLTNLREALASAVTHKVKAVILTGAGDCFSSGADLYELTGTPDDAAFDDLMSDIVRAVRDGPFLAIAAIEGPCIGAAFDLACACDARIASPSAFFELPAVRLGLLYNPSAVARIWDGLPPATVRRLLLLGERIEAGEAMSSAIATRLVDKGNTAASALALAHELTRNPRALIETKRLLASLERGIGDLAEWEGVRQELLGSSERRAALAAATSRRPVLGKEKKSCS